MALGAYAKNKNNYNKKLESIINYDNSKGLELE